MYWLYDKDDGIHDLCLHGHTTVQIGMESFSFDATISATALYLLKSLTNDHIAGKEIQMLPCCGHCIYADETGEDVFIIGCDQGIDWTVRHRGNIVEFITESGTKTYLPLEIYQKRVYQFADRIEAFYQRCPVKMLPTDPLDQEGYIVFWKEWHRRRGIHSIETHEI